MLGEDLAVALCQVVVADLVSLVDLEDLVGLVDLEGLVSLEDLVLVLVVQWEYWVIDSVDLVDRVCPDLPADLWVILPLWVPKECLSLRYLVLVGLLPLSGLEFLL